MRHVSVKKFGTVAERDRIDELMGHIRRLIRHRAYERTKVVSALLLRHLPSDAGYAWDGEERLRAHLKGAALDPRTLDHLIANARTEFERMLERITA